MVSGQSSFVWEPFFIQIKNNLKIIAKKLAYCNKMLYLCTIIKINHMQEESLYPIFWNGKSWKEEDCDDMFTDFYNSPYDLRSDGSIYLFSDIWIYPDGTTYDD